MATSDPPPPPPPTPTGVYKLAGIYPPDQKAPDPNEPLVGFAENKDKGIFIYLVDKQVVFDFLVKDLSKIKDNKEVVLKYDNIIPTLNRNMMKSDLILMYPKRGLLIYEIHKKEEHIQLVANILCQEAEPGSYEFLSCDGCTNVVSVNYRFRNFGYIRSADHCCNMCNCPNTLWVSDYKINEDL